MLAESAQTSDSDRDVHDCLSLEELLQRFPGLAATIVGSLDQDGKKALRICSRACKAAADPLLTRVRVAGQTNGCIPLLFRSNWRHLHELHL